MKVLAISDIHGDSGLVKRVAKIADEEKIDTIIIAGDLTWLSKKAVNIISPLIKKNREILIIPGNHDTDEVIDNLEKTYGGTRSIHKKNHKINDVAIFGSGTTDWGFYEESKKVYDELKKAHDEIKDSKKKIMVTHSPPEGSLIEELGFPGSTGIRKAIDKFKPDVLICGHIHEGGGLIEQIGKTKVINVARTPMIFEI